MTTSTRNILLQGGRVVQSSQPIKILQIIITHERLRVKVKEGVSPGPEDARENTILHNLRISYYYTTDFFLVVLLSGSAWK